MAYTPGLVWDFYVTRQEWAFGSLKMASGQDTANSDDRMNTTRFHSPSLHELVTVTQKARPPLSVWWWGGQRERGNEATQWHKHTAVVATHLPYLTLNHCVFTKSCSGSKMPAAAYVASCTQRRGQGARCQKPGCHPKERHDHMAHYRIRQLDSRGRRAQLCT
jgi:hypothetical protein